MASNQGPNTNTNTTTTNLSTHHHEIRAYRKGNWTINETMVLIEAKRMDDERRMKRNIMDHNTIETSNPITMRSKPTELRWKWVEDFCCKLGCLRSQNQCNDKWDNLMRDYKKVREHERRVADQKTPPVSSVVGGGGGGGGGGGCEVEELISYWRMEKAERKDKGLPANMLTHVYQALVDVVENRKGSSSSSSTLLLSPCSSSLVSQQNMVINSSVNVVGGLTANMNPNIDYHSYPYPHNQQQQHHHTVQQQQQISAPIPPMLLQLPTTPRPPPQPPQPTPSPPPPPQQLPLPLPPPPPPPPPHSQPLPTVDSSDTSEHSDSPAKRRRTSGGEAGTSSEPPPASGSGGGGSAFREVGNAITKSASVIAKALRSKEEREDRRHKDLVSLHERRLKIEESKSEINRQGINGLVDAINKLANSILALASNNKNQ